MGTLGGHHAEGGWGLWLGPKKLEPGGSRFRPAPIGINLSMGFCASAILMLTTTNHSQDQRFEAWAF
jgi:hypothetical protein